MAAEPAQPAGEPAVRTLASAGEQPTAAASPARPGTAHSNPHPSPPRGWAFHGDAAVPPTEDDDDEAEHAREDEPSSRGHEHGNRAKDDDEHGEDD